MSEQPTRDALTQQRDREQWLTFLLFDRSRALHRVITERDEVRAQLQRLTDKGTD